MAMVTRFTLAQDKVSVSLDCTTRPLSREWNMTAGFGLNSKQREWLREHSPWQLWIRTIGDRFLIMWSVTWFGWKEWHRGIIFSVSLTCRLGYRNSKNKRTARGG